MMSVKFILGDNGISLPLLPENILVTRASEPEIHTITGFGDIAVPQRPQLADIVIESAFWAFMFEEQGYREHVTQDGYPILEWYKYKTAKEYADWFKTWQRLGRVARWVVESDVDKGTNLTLGPLWVICTGFDYDVRAGETDDVYYTLSLKEYRPYAAKVVVPANLQIQADGVVTEHPSPERVQEDRVIRGLRGNRLTVNPVKGLNSIMGICSLFGVDSDRFFNELATKPENRGVLSFNHNGEIEPDIILTIPDSWLVGVVGLTEWGTWR